MRYSDKQRLEKICFTAGKLLDYLTQEKITPEIVLTHGPVRWAITTPLYNIGEQVYHLSDAFTDAHPNIPWAKISGLRHRLVHNYEPLRRVHIHIRPAADALLRLITLIRSSQSLRMRITRNINHTPQKN